MPRASSAVMAAESWQPVPCVCGVVQACDPQLHGIAAVVEDIDGFVAAEMSALHQACGCTQIDECAGGLAHLRYRADRHPSQRFGFGHVRRHQRRQRQELTLQRRARRWFEQCCAALRQHDGIDNERRNRMLAHGAGDGPDDLRGNQHAGLGRIHADIRNHGIDLLPARTRAGTAWMPVTPHVFCAVSAVTALIRKHPKDGEGLQIRLNAGATARVGAGNCEGPGEHERIVSRAAVS